jgi:hypothetical protein
VEFFGWREYDNDDDCSKSDNRNCLISLESMKKPQKFVKSPKEKKKKLLDDNSTIDQ